MVQDNVKRANVRIKSQRLRDGTYTYLIRNDKGPMVTYERAYETRAENWERRSQLTRVISDTIDAFTGQTDRWRCRCDILDEWEPMWTAPLPLEIQMEQMRTGTKRARDGGDDDGARGSKRPAGSTAE